VCWWMAARTLLAGSLMGGLRGGSTVPSARAFYVALGANLSRARERAELTQQDVADALGMTRAAVSNVEQGNTGLPVHRLVEWTALLCVKLGTIVPKNV
jgi:DNA-binding XRE family transcriptional regulator